MPRLLGLALVAFAISAYSAVGIADDKVVLDAADLGIEAVKAVTGNKKVRHTGPLTMRPGKVYEARVANARKLTALANRARLTEAFKVSGGETVRIRMTQDGHVILAIPTGDWCLKRRSCKVQLRKRPDGKLEMQANE